VVKGLNLALKANECFGLLGSNGAGKTTTFRMLTGDIKNTAGDIYVCGVNVSNNREKVNRVIIYVHSSRILSTDRFTCFIRALGTRRIGLKIVRSLWLSCFLID